MSSFDSGPGLYSSSGVTKDSRARGQNQSRALPIAKGPFPVPLPTVLSSSLPSLPYFPTLRLLMGSGILQPMI